jgi:hypothetical protein
LRWLYIARDNDRPATPPVTPFLFERARAAGIEAIVVSPQLDDLNEDRRILGADSLRAQMRNQIAAQDVARFMALAA